MKFYRWEHPWDNYNDSPDWQVKHHWLGIWTPLFFMGLFWISTDLTAKSGWDK